MANSGNESIVTKRKKKEDLISSGNQGQKIGEKVKAETQKGNIIALCKLVVILLLIVIIAWISWMATKPGMLFVKFLKYPHIITLFRPP